MTTTALPSRTARLPRTIALLAAGAVVASVADVLVASGAVAVGADASYAPLSAAVLVPFSVLGFGAGLAGWLLVRRLSPRPSRMLRVLVPVAVAASWLPDLLVAPGIPGATAVGIVALVLMHLVVAAVGVPVYRSVAPLQGGAEAGR